MAERLTAAEYATMTPEDRAARKKAGQKRWREQNQAAILAARLAKKQQKQAEQRRKDALISAAKRLARLGIAVDPDEDVDPAALTQALKDIEAEGHAEDDDSDF